MSRRRRRYSINSRNYNLFVGAICAFFIAIYHFIRIFFIYQENKKKASTVNGVSNEMPKRTAEAQEWYCLDSRFYNKEISGEEYEKEKKRLAAKYGKEY